MTAPALADVLGPRARRRTHVASAVSGVFLVIVVIVAVQRFADKGQLDGAKWEPLADWGTIRFLLGGLGNTLKAAGVAMALAMATGALLALGRLVPNVILRNAAGSYVELFRSAPLLL